MFRKKIVTSVVLISVLAINITLTNAALIKTDTLESMGKQANAVGTAGGYVVSDTVGFGDVAAAVIKGFLGLLGIIFVIMLILGGYNYMTAGGNEEKVTKATKYITRAIIGLFISVSAYSITYFVFEAIGKSGAVGGAP